MKTIKLLILLFALTWSAICSAQRSFKNVLELNFEAGLTSDLKSEKIYFGGTSLQGLFTVENRFLARTSNFGASYTRFFSPKFGLKLSFGKATFGFNYNGRNTGASTALNPVAGSLRTTHAELGVSIVYKIPLTPFINLLLEPSIRLHTEHEQSSNTIFILTTDSFSYINYSGIEFPFFSNNFFINTGLLIKLPLKKYDYNDSLITGYRPYFIGIKIGLNYQF